MFPFQVSGQARIPERNKREIFARRMCSHSRQFSIGNERETLGPKLAIHPHFIHGANISFAAVTEAGQIDLVVWERGCGFTQACGTGACATAVVGWLDGHIRPGPVRVNLPGGALEISGTAESVTMRGPAVHVYDGHWLGIP